LTIIFFPFHSTSSDRNEKPPTEIAKEEPEKKVVENEVTKDAETTPVKEDAAVVATTNQEQPKSTPAADEVNTSQAEKIIEPQQEQTQERVLTPQLVETPKENGVDQQQQQQQQQEEVQTKTEEKQEALAEQSSATPVSDRHGEAESVERLPFLLGLSPSRSCRLSRPLR
jgi:hypothetical protein